MVDNGDLGVRFGDRPFQFRVGKSRHHLTRIDALTGHAGYCFNLTAHRRVDMYLLVQQNERWNSNRFRKRYKKDTHHHKEQAATGPAPCFGIYALPHLPPRLYFTKNR